ncbi:SMI1/KNR4 family protein [Streptomyces sp. NBC_01451]|uniref:SMI1/KNR4 family protein n=1 Tax=Streptomyces sp. NBC_01451 TaxID=2903872 RepID=UPI002E307A5C|nr:SMI1/KNR4 family protein [Streptomyces sp. NBC_01451]
MSRNYVDLVIAMMGSPENLHAADSAWRALESELGVQFPVDYRLLVDGYGPIQVNGHLYLSHPATERWNLGRWISSTIAAFERSDLSGAECPGFENGPIFGGPDGLIPLASTDRGEYVFGAIRRGDSKWRILACDGDEQDFYEYRMGFSEWLYGYLSGGDMFGPDSAAFYPGPLLLESMPLTVEDRSISWRGPQRGM